METTRRGFFSVVASALVCVPGLKRLAPAVDNFQFYSRRRIPWAEFVASPSFERSMHEVLLDNEHMINVLTRHSRMSQTSGIVPQLTTGGKTIGGKKPKKGK